MLILRVLPETYTVLKFAQHEEIPEWAIRGAGLFSITRTADELSIFCERSCLPNAVETQEDLRCLRLDGDLPYDQAGILYQALAPFAQNEISIFAISTHDRDYIFVRSRDLSLLRDVLNNHESVQVVG